MSLKPTCMVRPPQSVGAEGPRGETRLATGATLGAKFTGGGCKPLILVILINVFQSEKIAMLVNSLEVLTVQKGSLSKVK